MNIDPALRITLTLISGISWTLVYILIINRSFKDKTYGMPFWALAFNISWEFIFSFIFVSDRPDHKLQHFVNEVWLVFDVIILVTYFLYGKKDWPEKVSSKWFYPYSVLVLAATGIFVYMFCIELNNKNGMYMAFIQNMMMSWLFIAMLIKRNNLHGQLIGIGVFKLLGTLAPTLLFGLNHPFVMFLGINCFVADSIYIAMLWNKKRKLALS